jgi:hypothetical protein
MYQVNPMPDKSLKQAETTHKKGRPKVARPMKRVNISVDPVDYEAIERLALTNGVSSAMLIRLAMKHFLRSKSGKKDALVA